MTCDVAVLEGVAHGAFADGVENPVLEPPILQAPEGAGAFKRRRVAVGGEGREEVVGGLGERARRDGHAVVAEDPRLAIAHEPAWRNLVPECVVSVDDARNHPVGGDEGGRGSDGDLDGACFVRGVGRPDDPAEKREIICFDVGVAHDFSNGVPRGAVDVPAALFVDLDGERRIG